MRLRAASLSKQPRSWGFPVQFWTGFACSLIGDLQYEELLKRSIVPFNDENVMHNSTHDKPIDWIPRMKNIRFKDLPSLMRTQSSDDIMFDFLGSPAQNCSRSTTIIFNMFHELEREALQAISAKYPAGRIYNIGPLGLLSRPIVPPESRLHSLSSSLWKEDSTCLANSVVYINYESITTMAQRSFVEFAWELAKSEHYFLWIVRPNVVVGSDSATLPEEFYEEVKDRGLIAKWCPQERVLSHSSVGAFLTHCGWNSTLNAVCAGVPATCWPFLADQQTNWGIGVEKESC